MFIAVHHDEKKDWFLVVVLSKQRLRDILSPEVVMSCTVSKVPGFGNVPTIALSCLSTETLNHMGRQGLASALQEVAVEYGVPVTVPIVVTPRHLRDFAEYGMALVDYKSPPVADDSLAPWHNMSKIFLFQADTVGDVRRLMSVIEAHGVVIEERDERNERREQEDT
jgi:hypothetical protein